VHQALAHAVEANRGLSTRDLTLIRSNIKNAVRCVAVAYDGYASVASQATGQARAFAHEIDLIGRIIHLETLMIVRYGEIVLGWCQADMTAISA
jgi:hypothetical protein